MMRLSILWLGLAILSACATQPSAERIRVERNAAQIPSCDNAAECERMWQAAEGWIAANAGYRISRASDTVIETYGPLGVSGALAARVVKEPRGQDQYRFRFQVACSNPLGCYEDPVHAQARFNMALWGVGDGVLGITPTERVTSQR